MSQSLEGVRVKGSCLCGAVEYEATGPFVDFRYCHCERCRKATGSAHSANMIVPKEQLSWISGEKDVMLFIQPLHDHPRRIARHRSPDAPHEKHLVATPRALADAVQRTSEF